MKVVYVSTIERGGPLIHMRELVPRVAAAGVDVHVICGSDELAEEFRRLGATASAVPVGHKLDFAGGARLWPHLDRADLVHTQDRRAGLFGRVAGRLRRAHVVHTLHGMPEEFAARIGRADAPDAAGASRARLAWLLHGYLPLEASLARLGTVVSPSKAMAAFLLAHRFPSARVRVIPNGVDVPAAPEARPSREALVAGLAANLEPWKGVDVLLEAARRMQAPLRLEIYGDGSLRGELEQQSAGLDARFHGFVQEMTEAVAGLDVLVQPSRAENLPLAVLQAMAAGLPVIATRVGGIPEVVVDGETGILVEPDDPEAIADALDSLAANPERRRKLGEAGRERVREHFSADGMARRTLALYEELCGSST